MTRSSVSLCYAFLLLFLLPWCPSAENFGSPVTVAATLRGRVASCCVKASVALVPLLNPLPADLSSRALDKQKKDALTDRFSTLETGGTRTMQRAPCLCG